MLTLGIDIGSTTSKCIVLQDGAQIISQALVPSGIGTTGPRKAVDLVLKQAALSIVDISYTAVTGYGRNLWQEADCQVSELSCHAMGAAFVFPEVRTVIDIGGQDAKIIAVGKDGTMENFTMNDKCAAGTGRFLDVMAQVLQVNVDDLGALAEQGDCPAGISSTCTVFAESEVISQLASGTSIENIVAGICCSVARRTAAMAKRTGVRQQVCMSGGVARNSGVRKALAQELQMPVLYSPTAQMFGALGAALYAKKQFEKREIRD